MRKKKRLNEIYRKKILIIDLLIIFMIKETNEKVKKFNLIKRKKG